MRFVVTILTPIAGALLVASALAQLPTMNVGGGGFGGAGAAYQGPGDIISGAKAWVGNRAYTAAIAAAATQKLFNLKRTSDSQTCDFIVTTTAGVGNSANCSGAFGSGSLTSFCNATTCQFVTWYDQSGNNGCAGSPCDLVNVAADSTKPTITLSQNNGLPCANFVSASLQFMNNNAGLAVAQTSGIYYAGIVNGSSTVNSGISGSFNGGATDIRVEIRSGPAFGVYAGGSFVTQSMTLSAFHRVQGQITNGGTNSFVIVDGSTGSTGSAGTDTLSGWFAGQDLASKLDGAICEQGWWGTTPNGTQQTNIDSNMNNSGGAH